MTSFDGSTSALAAAGPQPLPPGEAPEVEGTDAGLSALELLRERVADAQEVREDWVHTIRRTKIRLTCDTNIEATDQQKWVNAALPRTARRRGNRAPDPTKMRRDILAARAIIESCTLVEIAGTDGVYKPVISPSTQQPLLPNDQELLMEFQVPDPIELLRKFFIRDADLINAGEDLLSTAGFMGDEEDEPDPT